MIMKKTVFLDRDGVINRKIRGYVNTWTKFDFLEGVLEAMPILARKFDYIIIITNQQGVGKELMSLEDLEVVHQKMLTSIEEVGGRIDKIFACTCLATDAINCRKPNPTMVLDAQKTFKDIDINEAIMVGDMPSDLKLAQGLEMPFVWLDTHDHLTEKERLFLETHTSRKYQSLLQWCTTL